MRLKAERGYEDWTVLHSLDLAGHIQFQRSEADFVLLVPDFGILVIEVKGHGWVRRDPATGLWSLGHDAPRQRSPFRQASEAMYSIRDQLKEHRPEWAHLQFEILVVFPFAEFIVEDGGIEWHAWQVADRRDLSTHSLAELALNALECARRDAVERRGTRSPFPLSKAAADEVLRVLCPSVGSEQVNRQAQRELEHRDLLRHEDELDVILDAVWRNDRLLVRGGPGAGKTALLVKAAARAAAEAPGRVRLMCFNRLLAQHLSQQLIDVAEVTTLNQLLGSLDVHAGAVQLAQRRAAGEFSPAQILLLDETQDLLNSGARAVLDLCVEGGLRGGRVMAALDDLHQRLYRHDDQLQSSDFLYSAATVDLADNRRNLPRVSALASSLSGRVPWRRTLRQDDQAEPTQCFAPRSALITRLAELVQQFELEGFKRSEMVILSGCRPEMSLAQEAQRRGLPVRPLGEASVETLPFASIHAFKGLEAPVVILTDLPHGPHPDTLMLVGLTRSSSRAALLIEHTETFVEQYIRRTL